MCAGSIPDKHLSSPDRAVGAVPGSVEHDADGRSGVTMFAQHGGEVGMVVLDPEQRYRLRVRPLRRQVGGVQVVHEQLRLRPENPQQMGRNGIEMAI